MTYLYSPLPMREYRLQGLDADEVSVIEQSGAVLPIWNLFWLSNPKLDLIPLHGDRWWSVYRPDAAVLSSCIRDSYNDSTLCQVIVDHPYVFLPWFETQVHQDYHSYEVLGGKRWVELVMTRAEEAGSRLVSVAPPVRITADGKLKVLT